MAPAKLETVSEFTRRAIRATNELIPPTVFVPLALRRSKKRLVGRAITTRAPDQAEIDEAIARAAPHEFLVAVMQGQPLPKFTLTETPTGFDVAVSYEVPSVPDRVAAAAALHGRRYAQREFKTDDGFDAAVRNAASRVEDDPYTDQEG